MRSLVCAHGSVGIALLLGWTASVSAQERQVQFRRGDANTDGSVDVSDSVFTLAWLFTGGPVPSCLKAADASDDGGVDISDPIYALNFLFLGGFAPPAPHPACGVDPTPDNLTCTSYPPCPGTPTEPIVEVLESDNERLAASFRFPEPEFQDVDAGGEKFVELSFPGLEPADAYGGPASAGQPGVPVYYKLIAVPMGSQPFVRIRGGQSRTLDDVHLRPQQESPVDRDYPPVKDGALPFPEVFEDLPFFKDEKIYQVDEFFPPRVASVTFIGRMRDLWVAQLMIAPAQYNPVRKVLRIHEEVEVDVGFDGGTGSFLPQRALNPFESYNFDPMFESAILNGDIVRKYTELFPIRPLCAGEELLIISDPAFQDAANDLHDWKETKGIVTTVVLTGPTEGGRIGQTNTEIRDFIRSRYSRCLVRLSYVLLLGDAEHIPPFYRSSSGSSTTGTDLDYSMLDDTDLLADLGVARIPVDTLEQAQVVVDKIIGYESNPPPDLSFYNTASIPAYFQCCRTDVNQVGTTSRGYIETMELIRDEMVDQGYEVERLYFSDTTYHSGYSGDTTPRRYRDGTALPTELGPSSGFAWDAGRQDVIDSINDGRFLVIHRDHGGQNGWVFPALSTGDAASLTNDRELPVLFSVDCATGLFDNETAGGDYGTTNGGVYLLEALLRREGGGVVGALGDTRNSPTWANNALTRGFSDAVFPDVVPSYGGTSSIRRLADILNYGKLYMFSQVGVSQTAGSVSQNNADSNNVMWHAFGDPTQEIWTRVPLKVLLRHSLQIFKDRLVVNYELDGTVITAMQKGVPIGRATVLRGEAVLQFVTEPEDGVPIDLSASKEGYVSARLTSGRA